MKRNIISIIVFILVISMFNIVNAATGSINAGSNVDKVKPGETFTVSVVGTADADITGFQASLQYDKSKLLLDTKNSKVGETFDKVSEIGGIAGAIADASYLSKTGTLYTLVFSVMESAEEGEATLIFSDVKLATTNGNVEDIEKEIVTITIKKEQEEPPVQDTTPPVGNIVYTTNEDGSITATISFNEANVTITNNDGKNTYVFTKNGEFTFEFKDEAGNQGTATAKVTDIEDGTGKDEGKLPQTGVGLNTALSVVGVGGFTIAFYVLSRKYRDIK